MKRYSTNHCDENLTITLLNRGSNKGLIKRLKIGRAHAHWRLGLLACGVALLLQTALMLALAGGSSEYALGGASVARAAALHDDDDTLRRSGIVLSRPAERAGTWQIGAHSYTVTEATEVDEDVALGDCVEATSAASAPAIALKIEAKELAACDENDDGDDGDGDNDDDDDDRKEWEGILVSFPPALIGEWVISIGESKIVTFTTSLGTRFSPELPTEYAAGRWVEVRLAQRSDGSWLAQRVRLDEYEVGEIVVRLESSQYSTTLAAEYGLVLTSTLLSRANIYLYATSSEDEREVARQIEREEGVIWAEVNYVNSVPEDDGYKTWGWGGAAEPDAFYGQSAYQQIRLGQVSNSYAGEGVVVAVLDTGIYIPHEKFAGKLSLPSLDVIDDDNDPSEEGPGLAWGHGTHVAGVISAIAPDANILPVRVLDENGRGNTFLLAYAIEWVAQQPGVKVINLSLGTDSDSRILRDVIQAATEDGILVVAAAGNNATNQVQYPAGYPGVIGVTAVDSSSQKAPFANYGAEWVDLAAPGVSIMSTMINDQGPGYATWSGTSMATAFVSGAAALVVEKWQVYVTSGGEMLNQIVETGLTLDALNPAYAGQIGRLLDVSAALEVDSMLLFMPQAEK